MRDNNTQGKTEFITEHIFWLALAWIWYRSLLFRCVPQHTLTESKLILLGFVLVFSAVGILFQMQNNRNGMGVILDLVLGYGAYTVLTYWPIYPRLIKICLVAAGILSLLYAALVLCRRMRSRKYVLKILRRRLGLVAFMSKKIVGMSLALIMGGSGASVLFGSSLLKSDVRPATKTNLSEQTIANNMHPRPPLSRLRPSPRRRFLPAGHAGCARPVQRRCYGWPDNLSQQDKAPI